MNLETQIALLALTMLVPVLGLVLMKRGNRVAVLGVNIEAGTAEYRRLKLKNGAAAWKMPDGKGVALPLAEGFGYQGPKGSTFIADLSSEQGRLVRIHSPTGDTLGMPGERLWAFAMGGGLKQVADSQTTDFQKLLMTAGIILGFLLIAILGAVVYLLKMFQDAQAVPV